METNGCLTIGLVGAGGDGVALMGSLLQRLAAAVGYAGQLTKFYGAQIRGGGSAVKLTVAALDGAVPDDFLDVLVCFDWAEFAGFRQELMTSTNTLVLAETPPPDTLGFVGSLRLLPFGRLAQEHSGAKRNKNIVALGTIAALLGLDGPSTDSLIAADKKFKAVAANPHAYSVGRALPHPIDIDLARLAPPASAEPRRILSGNDAVVEGALAAGCRACFFYPITPASEISEMMGRRLAAMGGAYRQAEDEIAAIMNGIGASLTGAKVLVATSGPGLSLMSEALSFAVGAEIPLVIVDVQRGGPSTGVPTRTEQSDLFHAVYGGHGDAPRVVLAPHDLESVWRLTRHAFNIAERYQTPVIVLSDQLLGQSTFALDGAFLRSDYPIVERTKPTAKDAGNYRRYEDTRFGVSPMANFGDPGFVYQASGLSHREDGSHRPTFEVASWWHEKVARKLDPLKHACGNTRFYGPTHATDRLITWGSSAQAVLAAVEASGLSDRLAVCVPEMIAPLPFDVARFTARASRLMVVELNHGAQFAHHLSANFNLSCETAFCCRSGARPFGTQEIVAAIHRFFGGEERKS